MTKKTYRVVHVMQCIVVCVSLVMVTTILFGCAKKQPPLPEPQVKQEPVAPPPKPVVVDTSDQTVFKPVDLEAQFQREVEENLQTVY
ncbi:MAG: hypothetical protein JW795_19555, partial [Chitinivibrionales bacterium]|nr:hypothetical protein [Chitinivibrionales bacterium]